MRSSVFNQFLDIPAHVDIMHNNANEVKWRTNPELAERTRSQLSEGPPTVSGSSSLVALSIEPGEIIKVDRLCILRASPVSEGDTILKYDPNDVSAAAAF